MMETFLLALRVDEQAALRKHAESAVDLASAHGAAFTPLQRDKALIHTWLAWCDPPGRQLHDAVKQAMLDPTRPYAEPFLAWFKALYEIHQAPPSPPDCARRDG